MGLLWALCLKNWLCYHGSLLFCLLYTGNSYADEENTLNIIKAAFLHKTASSIFLQMTTLSYAEVYKVDWESSISFTYDDRFYLWYEPRLFAYVIRKFYMSSTFTIKTFRSHIGITFRFLLSVLHQQLLCQHGHHFHHRKITKMIVFMANEMLKIEGCKYLLMKQPKWYLVHFWWTSLSNAWGWWWFCLHTHPPYVPLSSIVYHMNYAHQFCLLCFIMVKSSSWIHVIYLPILPRVASLVLKAIVSGNC